MQYRIGSAMIPMTFENFSLMSKAAHDLPSRDREPGFPAATSAALTLIGSPSKNNNPTHEMPLLPHTTAGSCRDVIFALEKRLMWPEEF